MHVHRAPRHSSDDVDERLQRTLQANAQLQRERGALADKLRRVQTQFRKLQSDWRCVQQQQQQQVTSSSPDRRHGDTSTRKGDDAAATVPPARAASAHAATTTTAATRQQQQQQRDNAMLRGNSVTLPSLHTPRIAVAAPPSPQTTTTSAAHDAAAATCAAAASACDTTTTTTRTLRDVEDEVQRLRRTLAERDDECAALRTGTRRARDEVEQLRRAHARALMQVDSMQAQLQSSVSHAQSAEQHYRATVDALVRERDALTLRLRAMETTMAAATTAAAAAAATTMLPTSATTATAAPTANISAAHRTSAADANAATATVSLDEQRIAQLQSEVRASHNEAALLRHALQRAEAQSTSLQDECASLLTRVAEAHGEGASLRQHILQLEHRNATLQTRAAEAETLQATLRSKDAALREVEEQVLQLTRALQTCAREAEAAVRREYDARIAALQEQRSAADAQRRRAECAQRAAVDCADELRRELAEVRDEAQVAAARVTALERRARVAAAVRAARARTVAAAASKHHVDDDDDYAQHSASAADDDEEDSDDESRLQQALSVAAVLRRRERERRRVHSTTTATATATTRHAQTRRDSNKDEDKRQQQQHDVATAAAVSSSSSSSSSERAQLREALATTTCDLAATQTQCSSAVAQTATLQRCAQRVCDERDVLLDENVQLRQRLEHVQTTFARQQLQAYNKAKQPQQHGEKGDTAASHGGVIELSIVAVRPAAGADVPASAALLRALGVVDAHASTTSFFFALDGLPTHDTMLSPTLHALDEAAGVTFVYPDLDADVVTVAMLRQATWTLQLHRVVSNGDGHDGGDGSGSGSGRRAGDVAARNVLVAMAELPGAVLLTAREVTIRETLPLISGSGDVLGYVDVDVCCSQLLLPVLLSQPLRPHMGNNNSNSNNSNCTPASAALSTLPSLSAERLRAALVALRAVHFLRVQVFRAQGLATHHASDDSSNNSNNNNNNSNDTDDKTTVVTTRDAAADSLPQPYVFITSYSAVTHTACDDNNNNNNNTGNVAADVLTSSLSCIRDAVVHPVGRTRTTDPIFDAAPIDYRVVVDTALVTFLEHGVVVFTVFDARARDAHASLGVVEVPLHPLLASPRACIRTTGALHPSGTLSVGLAWVTAP